MLSCRYSGPACPPYQRRLESADRVLAIMTDADRPDPLPLPLIPYAVSISTCVIYRALRDGARESVTAYRDLEVCCDVLESLSDRWTSTRGICKLARKLCSIPRADIGRKPSGSDGDGLSRSDIRVSRNQAGRPNRLEDGCMADEASPGMSGNGANYGSLPAGQAPADVQSTLDFPQSAPEYADDSFVNLDRAFSDIFDFSLPTGFGDPAAFGVVG